MRSALGLIEIHLGRYAEAEAALTEAASLARWSGDRRAEASALRNLGLLGVMRGDFDDARKTLLGAMAMDRDRGDPGGEGTVAGLLGIAHHLADQLDAARESYRRAADLLEASGEQRMLALFGAWSAALEAERGATSTARTLFEEAQVRHDQVADPQVAAALDQLRGALELMEAAAAEGNGDHAAAAEWRSAAEARWTRAHQSQSPLPVEARLAHGRVGKRLNR